MPIYEYRCTECDTKFEVRQSIGEDGSELSCPACSAISPERLFSSFFSSGSGADVCSDVSSPT